MQFRRTGAEKLSRGELGKFRFSFWKKKTTNICGNCRVTMKVFLSPWEMTQAWNRILKRTRNISSVKSATCWPTESGKNCKQQTDDFCFTETAPSSSSSFILRCHSDVPTRIKLKMLTASSTIVVMSHAIRGQEIMAPSEAERSRLRRSVH